METRTGYITPRRWQAVALCFVAAALGVVTMPIASAGKAKAPAAGLLDVRFSEDCVSAMVESSKEVSSIVAVFNDGRWEQLDGLPRIVSYVVKVGPNASESGLAIATLYVDTRSRTQQDPLGIVPHKVGIGFECKQSEQRVAARMGKQ